MDSFIALVGGKKLLRKEIVSRFPEKFNRYVEVFGGAAWVLFYKEVSKNEVYNDINGELVNLFRCVKYHPEAIEKELEFVLNSRETFEDFIKNKNGSGSTDIQRAARYLYLIKASYGAKATTYVMRNRDVSNTDALYAAKERLSRAVIEHKSFDNLIAQYNKEDTLFYCVCMIQGILFLTRASILN